MKGVNPFDLNVGQKWFKGYCRGCSRPLTRACQGRNKFEAPVGSVRMLIDGWCTTCGRKARASQMTGWRAEFADCSCCGERMLWGNGRPAGVLRRATRVLCAGCQLSRGRTQPVNKLLASRRCRGCVEYRLANGCEVYVDVRSGDGLPVGVLSVAQAAVAVGRADRTLWQHIRDGKLVSEQFAGAMGIRVGELRRVYGEVKV